MTSITEPATLITDYLLAAFTAVLAWKLGTDARHSQRWWTVAFGATAVAGLAGGTVHGFRLVMPPIVTNVFWTLALEALVVAGFAIVAATWRAITVAACAFALYGVWVATHPLFVFAIVGYGAALVALTAVHLRRWMATGSHASEWMLGGVAVSVLAAIAQQGGWDPHRWFNHNDLYHVIQAAAVWMLYRGVRPTPSLALAQPPPPGR